MKRFFLAALLFTILGSGWTFCQSTYEGVVSVDSSVHDFGDIFVDDGPVECSFKFTNISKKPILIFSAVSSCGCTEVEWTREPVEPGKSGTVSATFNNEDGPYPFDKTVTVYVSDVAKPIVLHLRGVAHENAKPLKETYPIKIGNFGIKNFEIKAGNMVPGEYKSGTYIIANVGVTPMKVEFQNVSEGLTLSVFPNPVPAKSTAVMSYTVKARANSYGKNWYYATPVVDGRVYKATGKESDIKALQSDTQYYSEPNPKLGLGRSEIAIWAVVKPSFSTLPEEQKKNGPNPAFSNSTIDCGSVQGGTARTLTFDYVNKGKSTFKIYKVDADCHNVTVKSASDTEAGKKGNIVLGLDTYGLPKGENIILLNVFTNSPLRPVISLQIVVKVQ